MSFGRQILTVQCEGCGHRNTLERPVEAGEVVVVVCHECEGQLLCQADTVDELLAKAMSYMWPTDEW